MAFNPIAFATNAAEQKHKSVTDPKNGSIALLKRKLISDTNLTAIEKARGIGYLEGVIEKVNRASNQKVKEEAEFYRAIHEFGKLCDETASLDLQKVAQAVRGSNSKILLTHMAQVWSLREKDFKLVESHCLVYLPARSELLVKESTAFPGKGEDIVLARSSGKEEKVGEMHIVSKPLTAEFTYPVLSFNQEKGTVESLSLKVALGQGQLRDPVRHFAQLFEFAKLDFEHFMAAFVASFNKFFGIDPSNINALGEAMEKNSQYEFTLRSLAPGEQPSKDNGFQELAFAAFVGFNLAPGKTAWVKLLIPEGKVTVNYQEGNTTYSVRDVLGIS